MHRKSIYFLVLAVAILIVIGCVMLFSTSPFAWEKRGNPHYFIKSQMLWVAVGGVLGYLPASLDYHFWQRTWWIWFGLSAVLLVLCFVPPIGHRTNGSALCITLGVRKFHPSDLAKFAAVSAVAWCFSRERVEPRRFLQGFIAPLF